MYLQHLADALGPFPVEKDRLMANYNDMKIRLNLEYEDLAEQKRSYKQEAESLFRMNSKIKE